MEPVTRSAEEVEQILQWYERFLRGPVPPDEYVSFNRCRIVGFDFTGRNMASIHAVLAEFHACIFRGTDLSCALLFGVTAERADFTGANLAECDLREARLRGACLRDANLPLV